MGKKKFFTLLYGQDVHVSPGSKVIPAKVFSKALTAAEVLAHAQGEVDQYRQEVAEECEKLKIQAQQEGFQEALPNGLRMWLSWKPKWQMSTVLPKR